jgi:hypothetical protein
MLIAARAAGAAAPTDIALLFLLNILLPPLATDNSIKTQAFRKHIPLWSETIDDCRATRELDRLTLVAAGWRAA